MPHRVAVDGRIIERRQIQRRDHVACDHATTSLRERGLFRLRDRSHALADQPLHLGERQQGSGKREAILAELCHQQASANKASRGAAWTSSRSTTLSISSRFTTGTRADGTGWSDAIATMCGSSGCSNGLPKLARYTSSFGCGSRL